MRKIPGIVSDTTTNARPPVLASKEPVTLGNSDAGRTMLSAADTQTGEPAAGDRQQVATTLRQIIDAGTECADADWERRLRDWIKHECERAQRLDCSFNRSH